jgi:hypothetical protein
VLMILLLIAYRVALTGQTQVQGFEGFRNLCLIAQVEIVMRHRVTGDFRSNYAALPDDYLCSPTLCSDAGVIEYAPTRMDLEGTRAREQPARLNDK